MEGHSLMLFWVSLTGLIVLGWVLHFFIGNLGAVCVALGLGAVGGVAGQVARRSVHKRFLQKPTARQESPLTEQDRAASKRRA